MLLWKHPWLKGVVTCEKRLLMDFCDFCLISVQFTCWISVTGGGVISSFLWLLPFWCERAAVSCDVTLLLTQLQPVWQQCDQCDTLCDTLCGTLWHCVTHCVTRCVTTSLYFGGTTSYNRKQINVEHSMTTVHPLLHICQCILPSTLYFWDSHFSSRQRWKP